MKENALNTRVVREKYYPTAAGGEKGGTDSAKGVTCTSNGESNDCISG